jgi:uncharacterized protein (TIGR02996 family)
VGERERFLWAIEANPGDNATLLAYAEWLKGFAHRHGRIKDARRAASIRGFIAFSDQVAVAILIKPNPAQDPGVAKLVATEQRLFRNLLRQLLPKPGLPPEKTD